MGAQEERVIRIQRIDGALATVRVEAYVPRALRREGAREEIDRERAVREGLHVLLENAPIEDPLAHVAVRSRP